MFPAGATTAITLSGPARNSSQKCRQKVSPAGNKIERPRILPWASGAAALALKRNK